MMLLQVGSEGWLQDRYVFILLAAVVVLIAILGAVYFLYTSRVRKGFALPKLPLARSYSLRGRSTAGRGLSAAAF